MLKGLNAKIIMVIIHLAPGTVLNISHINSLNNKTLKDMHFYHAYKTEGIK